MKFGAFLVVIILLLSMANASHFDVQSFKSEVVGDNVNIIVNIQNNASTRKLFNISVDSELGQQKKIININPHSHKTLKFVFNTQNKNLHVINFGLSVYSDGQAYGTTLPVKLNNLKQNSQQNNPNNTFTYLIGILIILVIVALMLPKILARTPFRGTKEVKDLLKEEDIDKFIKS